MRRLNSRPPPDAAIRLSGSDTTFILDDPIEPQHTLKIAVFDEASSRAFQFERVSEALAGAVAVLPQMQWRVQSVPLGLNRPVWITDPTFDVRNHLRHVRLPEPGTKSQLCQKISEVASEPVRPGQPPWELWFLEGFEGIKVVAVLKMNHAIADGGTFALLLDLLSRPESTMPPIPHPVEKLSRGKALRDATRELWHELARELPRQTVTTLRARARRRKTPSPTRPPSMLRGPKLPWRGPLTPARSFSWVSVPLGEIKEIAKAISGTVNDVVFAIVAGAVRPYLAEDGTLTDQPVVGIAAAKHRRDGDTRLWGTGATSQTFRLPTHLADPMERLRAAHVQNEAVKAEVAARPVRMEDWFDFAPPILLRPMLRVTRLVGQKVAGGVIVSNVKGPREKRYVGGMGIENFVSCGHLKYAAGVNVTVWSYNGILNFAVYGCSRTLPDAELFAQRIQASFDELRAATGVSWNQASNGADRPRPARVNPAAAAGEQHV
jgi:diacylglycerol O-acyltransferase